MSLLLQSVQEQVKQEEAFAQLAASMRAQLADEPEAGDRIPAQSHNHALHLVKTDLSEQSQALNILAQLGSMLAALPVTSATETSREAAARNPGQFMQSHGEPPGATLCSLKAQHMRQPVSVQGPHLYPAVMLPSPSHARRGNKQNMFMKRMGTMVRDVPSFRAGHQAEEVAERPEEHPEHEPPPLMLPPFTLRAKRNVSREEGGLLRVLCCADSAQTLLPALPPCSCMPNAV